MTEYLMVILDDPTLSDTHLDKLMEVIAMLKNVAEVRKSKSRPIKEWADEKERLRIQKAKLIESFDIIFGV